MKQTLRAALLFALVVFALIPAQVAISQTVPPELHLHTYLPFVLNGWTSIPPAAPTQLSAAATSHTNVLLNWQDKSSNEIHFLVEMRVDGGSFTQIGELPRNTTQWLATLHEHGILEFRVRAENHTGYSAYSNTAAIQIAPLPTQFTLQNTSQYDITELLVDGNSITLPGTGCNCLPPDEEITKALDPGHHTIQVSMNPHGITLKPAFYQWSQEFDIAFEKSLEISVFDPTLPQMLTGYRSSAGWVSATNDRLCFYSDGSYLWIPASAAQHSGTVSEITRSDGISDFLFSGVATSRGRYYEELRRIEILNTTTVPWQFAGEFNRDSQPCPSLP